MIYSNCLENEAQSSKWDRMRINYDLFERVLKAKEHIEMDRPIKANPNLKIKTTVY